MNPAAAHAPSAAAEATLARQGRSFHWARRLLGATHAARATRLYAFCRHLDDLVDEAASPEAARAALAAADRDLAAGRSDDPILQDGLALMRECGIEPEIARELIAGMASDAETVRVADEAELLRYCYRAAGTVGLMMCRVLDAPEPAAAAHAVDLGIAMQLTNLCRDVADDARMGRRYLPASLVGDVAPAELIDPSPALRPKVCAAVTRLLALAETYYASGEAGLPFLPVRARRHSCRGPRLSRDRPSPGRGRACLLGGPGVRARLAEGDDHPCRPDDAAAPRCLLVPPADAFRLSPSGPDRAARHHRESWRLTFSS